MTTLRMRNGSDMTVSFTVTPAGGDSPGGEERPVKMTTEVRVRKRGRDVSR